jgi:uncharacterized protein (DUF427 family)
MSDRTDDTVRFEPGPKRIRAYLAGSLVADTTRPLLVWEFPYYPTYFVPEVDVLAELRPDGKILHLPHLGAAEQCDVVVGDAEAPGAARRLKDPPMAELAGHVRLAWEAMSEWFEEDEPVRVHPRDPYTRVDILASSRHVVVELDGIMIAESRQPRLLFETGLPTRYYLPLTDYRLDLLRPSATLSQCPYKGEASYFTVVTPTRVHEDIVWIYRSPLPESQKIIGLAAPYNEKVDLILDGVRLERPHTHFS